MENNPKVITISLPEYSIDTKPNYSAIGSRIDKAIQENFEGTFLVRALSITDHPQYTLSQLADIILNSGTDKYDPERIGVAHEEFEPYHADLQAGEVVVENGQLKGESFSEQIRLFYENTLIDRGYRLRIDLLVFYDPNQMVKAEKIDSKKPGVELHLEKYLWRFKDPAHKRNALKGIIKVLR